jgi:hypothetical protein
MPATTAPAIEDSDLPDGTASMNDHLDYVLRSSAEYPKGA